MTPDPKRTTKELDDAALIREMHRAIFVGDGKVGGAPGLVEAMNDVRKDITALKSAGDKTKDRAWAAALGASAGLIVAWAKSLFPHN